jgi:hypothetical protein
MRIRKSTLISFGFLCCLIVNFAFAQNCAAPPLTKPTQPSNAKSSAGREITVIQSVEGCTKAPASSGLDLIEKSAKYAIDASAEATKASASYAQNTLEIIKNFLIWSGLILSAILAIAVWYGWKSFTEWKTNLDAKAEEKFQQISKKYDEPINEKIIQIESIYNQVKERSKASDLRWKFSTARMESLLVSIELKISKPTRTQLTNSALSCYHSLLADMASLDGSVITDIVDVQGLRFESWDKDTTDDVAFFKSWLYRDAACLYKKLGQNHKALQAAKDGLAISPHDWGLKFNIACYHCIIGELDEAKETILKCLNSDYGAELASWTMEDEDLRPIMNDEGIKTLLSKLTQRK